MEILMKLKINIPIMFALLFVLFTIRVPTVNVRADTISDKPLSYTVQTIDNKWSDGRNSITGKVDIKGLKINFTDTTYAGDIQYKVFNPTTGWTDWINKGNNHNNANIGYITAIQVRTTGDLAKAYDVTYMPTYVDSKKNIVYMQSQKNGATAGSESKATDQPHITGITINLEPHQVASVDYTSHVQDDGWLSYVNNGQSGVPGKALHIEALKMVLKNADYSGDIQYEVNVNTKGWNGAKTNNDVAGTIGQNLPVQALKMQLTGEMANHYDIYYRVYAKDIGWLGWAKNNENAGGVGFNTPLYSYEVKLIAKGDPTPAVKANWPSYITTNFDARIDNVNNAAGTYDVIVDTKTAPVKRVGIPTWTTFNGQDDLQIPWPDATKQSDGTYKFTVKSTDHNYEYGEYISHVYMIMTNGSEISRAMTPTTLTPVVKSTFTTDKKNIYVKTTGTEPYKLIARIPLWSVKNGQDDLKWYDGANLTIPIVNHTGYGDYIAHTYYKSTTGANAGKDTWVSDNDVIKTSDNIVNILDENKWFPYSQSLRIFKNSDTSKNKIDVKNKPASATWSNGNRTINIMSSDDVKKNNIEVAATYYNAGEYKGKKIDIVETFKNFVPRDDSVQEHWYIYASENLYNGFFISGMWYSEVDVDFYEAGTQNQINVTAEDAFISTNSINGGEYTTYLNSQDNNRIYFTSDNNLVRGNPKDMGYPNNWNIWTNYKPVLYGGMQTSIGISDNFTDSNTGKTFSRNSAVYRLTGKTQKFIFGTNYGDIWATISSAAFNVKPDNPEKTITSLPDKTGKETDLSDQPVSLNKQVVYHVKQQVGQLGVTLINKYKKFELEDTLSANLQFDKAELYVDGKLNSVGTKLITYDAKTNKVSFKATDDYITTMPFDKETYDLRIYVKGKSSNGNAEPKVQNTANVTINDEHTPTRTIENQYVANTLKASVDNITIDSSVIATKQFNARVKLSQQVVSPDVLQYAKYQLIIDEVDSTGKLIKRAYSQDIQASQLKPEYSIALPFSNTKKADRAYYWAHFINLTNDVDFSANDLRTYGVTASQTEVTAPMQKVSDVVQTTKSKEDTLTKVFKETYTFDYKTSTDIKSGYGMPTDLSMTYTTEATNMNPDDVNINAPAIVQLQTNAKLLSSDSKVPFTTKGSNAVVNLDKTKAQYDGKSKITTIQYQYPQVFSKEKTGEVVIKSQKDADKTATYKDAGRNFYMPIWAAIQNYDMSYVSTKPIGINNYTINIKTGINVYAQMQATYDSKTVKFDELNPLPVLPDSFKKSGQWTDNDIKWVKESDSANWKGTSYAFKNGKWIAK